MGVIREELSIVDKFSAVFNQFTAGANVAVKNAAALQTNVNSLNGASIGDLTASMNALSNTVGETNFMLEDMAKKQDQVSTATKKTAQASADWLSTVKKVAATVGGIKLVNTFIETADAMSQMTAKFGLITENAEEVASLQNQIYQAAQRSRGSYDAMATTVTKLRQNAGEAFQNNDEAIQFAENLNKTFKLAGTSQAEMASASLQLTQALGSGALRGEEFRAVFEAAPAVIQRIADEMGKPVGAMKDLASKGEITADIVKKAMLNATDEINADFEKLPMTFSDIITAGKNNIQMAMRDVFADWTTFLNSAEMQAVISDVTAGIIAFAQVASKALMAIGNGLVWLHQNWQKLIPIIDVAAAAFTVLGIIAVTHGIATAAAWMAAHLPLLLIIAAVAGAIIAAQQMGANFEDVGRTIGAVFGYLYAFGYNLVADAWNIIASFAEFFANVFNDPVGAIAHLFVDAFDVVLGVVETVAAAIDALLGWHMADSIAGFRNQIQSAADEVYGTKQITFKRMDKLNGADTVQYMSKFADAGASIGAKLDNFELNLDGLLGANDVQASAVASNGAIGQVTEVGSIKNDVKLSDEDLKMYRDIAEAKYMQKIEVNTLQPNVNISVENAQNLNAEDVGDAVAGVLIEQMSSFAATSHG